VYYSYEEWGRGYIGYHKCHKRTPPAKDGYFGSFRDKTFKPTQKIILGEYVSKEEAIKAEIILHEFYQVDKNPHFANRVNQSSLKFVSPKVAWNRGKKTSAEAIEKRKNTIKARYGDDGFSKIMKKSWETIKNSYTKDEILEFTSKGRAKIVKPWNKGKKGLQVAWNKGMRNNGDQKPSARQ
jgi:hypothetical protein